MGFVGDLAKTEVKAKLCSLVKLVHRESQWFLELKGDTSHLEEIPGLQPEYSSLWQLPPTKPVG
jgi:hypothetical protein